MSAARALGAPVLSARIRATPGDFRVEELDGFEASGSGEHLLLTIEKRDMNTAFAARLLAQWAGVGDRAIGYAGLKDRHAITVQRFSVHLPGREAPPIDALEAKAGLRVLAQSRHARKLPRGALAGNRFVLALRGVEGERAAIEGRLRDIAARGVPNLFGEQRFGRGGDNVANALAMFAGRRVQREQRSLLLSAARSQIFDDVLAARVERGCWDTPLEGEIWSLAGSRSWFGPEPFSDELAARLARGDIHPSGPLWGQGEPPSQADAGAVEREVGTAHADQVAGLAAARMDQERRPLRLLPAQFRWRWLDDAALELSFELPAGAYATVVVRELANTM